MFFIKGFGLRIKPDLRCFGRLGGLLIAAALNCSASDASAQQNPAYRIAGVPTCPDCRIERTLVVEISDRAMPGALSDYAWVHVASDDRYFVVSGLTGEELYVADRTGTIQRRIGRTGQGPGEYRAPIHVVETGSAFWIVDPKNTRITSLEKRDFTLQGTRTLPLFPLSSPIEHGTRLILNGMIKGNAAAQPIHIYSSNGALLRSFGADNPNQNATPTSKTMTRVVATGQNGVVWSASPFEYRIEKWDTTGRRVATYVRELEWFKARTATESSEGLPHIRRLHEDKDGLLWVEIGIIRQDRTKTRSVPFDHSRSETYMEIIDPSSRRVVAARRFQGVFGFLANGGLFESTYSTDKGGLPRVHVWTYELRR